MRLVVRSRTYVAQLRTLLEFGVQTFGTTVADAKLARLDHVVKHTIAPYPATGTRDGRLGLWTYAIARTPFLVIYDFDDDELRLHFIVHVRADRSQIEPGYVEW